MILISRKQFAALKFSGAASYIVFVTSTLDQTSREIAVEETSTDVLGLSPGTQYFISVLSVGMEEQFSEITDPEEETTRE